MAAERRGIRLPDAVAWDGACAVGVLTPLAVYALALLVAKSPVAILLMLLRLEAAALVVPASVVLAPVLAYGVADVRGRGHSARAPAGLAAVIAVVVTVPVALGLVAMMR
ncbi:MAG: hypothetical protein KF878_20115 [Planctomycetes bacterium]|nr:hypothetical protein [Planctomycetota bacterium]